MISTYAPNRLKKWEKHHFVKKRPKDTWSPKRHHLTQKWPFRHQIDQKIVKITKLLKKRQKGTKKNINPKKRYQLAHHPTFKGKYSPYFRYFTKCKALRTTACVGHFQCAGPGTQIVHNLCIVPTSKRLAAPVWHRLELPQPPGREGSLGSSPGV